jgi:signal transduction histidine kinase
MSGKSRLKKTVVEYGFWVYSLVLVGALAIYFTTPHVRVVASFPLTRWAAGHVLFLVPVGAATYLFGLRGGLVTLLFAVPVMLARDSAVAPNRADALLEVIATSSIGYVVALIVACLRRNLSRLRAINAVSTALAESRELEQILCDVLDTLLVTLNVEAGAVYLVEEDQRGLALIHSRNLPPELFEGRSGLESVRALARCRALRHRIAVPIRSQVRVNGLIIVGQAWPRPTLCRERELVTTICNQINVFIENARLYEDVAHEFEIERSVYEVVNEITSELELDKVLPKVIAISEQLVGADSGLIALWDEERNVVTYPYLHNLPYRLAEVTVSREVGLSAEVMITGRPIIVDDYPNYVRAIPEFAQAGVKSIVGVPIVNGDRTFGTMCVMSIERSKHFLHRDVAVLTGIGRQAGIAVENAYLYENLRYYARRITQSQENERKRIARELHDDTIQSLIALSRRLEGLSTGKEALPEAVAERIRELWRQTSEMIQRVREFSHNLRPSVLDDLGLLPSLEELTTDLERQVGLQTEFRAVGEGRRLSSEVELTLFRIAQEALSNVRRHAKATRVTTTVELGDSVVRMRIEDDGVGFDPPKLTDNLRAEAGLGLIGMHERVRLLGGNLQIKSEPDSGTTVVAEVPI